MDIRVNGDVIAETAVAEEMQYHPAPSAEAARQAAAQALVVRELLLQEARRRGLAAAEEAGREPDEALIDVLMERLLDGELELPEPTEEECRRWFEGHRVQLATRESWEVSHLLVAAEPGDAKGRETARGLAESALRVIDGDPGRLSGLAAELSDCPSRSAGGDLGRVAAGQSVPEFERALAAMEEGSVCSAPVETPYGFHVIHLRRHLPAEEADYEHARERVAGYLRESVRRKALAGYLQRLAAAADIEGVELSGDAAELGAGPA